MLTSSELWSYYSLEKHDSLIVLINIEALLLSLLSSMYEDWQPYFFYKILKVLVSLHQTIVCHHHYTEAFWVQPIQGLCDGHWDQFVWLFSDKIAHRWCTKLLVNLFRQIVDLKNCQLLASKLLDLLGQSLERVEFEKSELSRGMTSYSTPSKAAILSEGTESRQATHQPPLSPSLLMFYI